MRVAIALLSCGLFGLALAQGNCRGATSSTFDDWCNASCNHSPSVCPSSLCACDGGSPPPSVGTCRAIGPLASIVGNSFCQTICEFNPDICPESICECDDGTFVVENIERHRPGCCPGDPRFLFYSVNGAIFKYSIDSSSPPQLCYSSVGGRIDDLAVDEDGNIYAANPVLGSVLRGNTDCSGSLESITTHITSPIEAPTGLEIANGVLFVSGHTRIYTVSFDADGNPGQFETLDATLLFSSDIEAGLDGAIYFIQQDASIMRIDPITGVVSVFLSVHQHNVPDLKGITLNACGLFFTATDSHQVFYCSSPTDGSTCRKYCDDAGIDASSCLHLRDPTAITSGCCCDIFVANPGNGNIVHYINDGIDPNFTTFPGEVDVAGAFHVSSLVVFSPRTDPLCVSSCEVTPPPTPSPSRSPTPSPSLTPSSSPTRTPSVTPTPSRTQTPTSSPTRTPSVTPSPSPSQTPSSSPTRSPSLTSSISISSSPTISTSSSPTPSVTRSPTSSPSATSSVTPSVSSTPSVSRTPTPSITPTSSVTPTPSVTRTPSPSPTPSTSSKVTGRLVPGVSLQASGGVQSASLLTGAVTLTLVKCPPGVPASDLTNCFASVSNTFKIPVSQLSIHNLVGQPTASSNLIPFITAVSAPNAASQLAAVSLFHVAPIIRNGSTITVCDLPCLAARQGTILPDTCSSTPMSATDIQARTRLAISAAAGGATVDTVNLPNNNFQSASVAICDGEVIGEFSVSLFGAGTASAVVNVASLPRLSFADRCNSSLSVGARLCYDTTQNPGVHGVFGDDQNLVCVAEFILDGSGTTFVEFDSNLSLLPGDIIDTTFRVNQNVRTCPFASDANLALRALCNTPTTRLVGTNECP